MNAQQGDYRVPTVSADVASYPVGANVLDLTWPIAEFVQPNVATSVPDAQLDGGPMGISKAEG
jgi:hypothetical protein